MSNTYAPPNGYKSLTVTQLRNWKKLNSASRLKFHRQVEGLTLAFYDKNKAEEPDKYVRKFLMSLAKKGNLRYVKLQTSVNIDSLDSWFVDFLIRLENDIFVYIDSLEGSRTEIRDLLEEFVESQLDHHFIIGRKEVMPKIPPLFMLRLNLSFNLLGSRIMPSLLITKISKYTGRELRKFGTVYDEFLYKTGIILQDNRSTTMVCKSYLAAFLSLDVRNSIHIFEFGSGTFNRLENAEQAIRLILAKQEEINNTVEVRLFPKFHRLRSLIPILKRPQTCCLTSERQIVFDSRLRFTI